MQDDLRPFGLITAHVVRTMPIEPCDHGLCPNGPQEAWGSTYFITLSTRTGVVSPSSPTRLASPAFNTSGLPTPAIIARSNVTSSVPGARAGVNISNNHVQDLPLRMPFHTQLSPLTIAFGGAGGSNGGVGGWGHARHLPPPVVLDDVVSDIIAGSSGAVGGEILQQTLNASVPCGAGGSGGGAVELIAVNDLIIGANGGVNVDGMDGESSLRAGGGGSGGTVLLSAGGVIVLHGTVTARGGKGGDGIGVGGRGGGGGGGGRIAGYAQALNMEGGGFNVSGGAGGVDGAPEVPPPTPYIGQIEVYYPWKSFFNGVTRTVSNTAGAEGVLMQITAGGAQYKISLEVRQAACRAVPRCAVPCRAVPCRAVPCRAVPCRAMPCRCVRMTRAVVRSNAVTRVVLKAHSVPYDCLSTRRS
jgi:hypothetical protein